ncbi:hypothetical protein HOLDEFILI_04137 [Holdemania filiformis DSM 12042]|uniref:Uncharacterized protein n=1 Tax=Holdemania filiformis DSM 12042 TaxID=545696 RepID=B9YE63_9FIRM|nr:hypothetical protein HOLDEFILI_04137 [Holdemania filiformis DSM 12042]
MITLLTSTVLYPIFMRFSLSFSYVFLNVVFTSAYFVFSFRPAEKIR